MDLTTRKRVSWKPILKVAPAEVISYSVEILVIFIEFAITKSTVER
jgi:hypothetical protein